MRIYSSYSDSELAFLLTKGDELAFTEIYNRFYASGPWMFLRTAE
ncbi:hypothetical protein ACTJKC_02850 [Pedobacter sp. 22226]